MYKRFKFDGTDTPYLVYDDGSVYDELHKHFVKEYLNNGGYPTVSFSLWIDGKMRSKRFLSHRLVAQLFIPNPENKAYVNHIDGNKQNNQVSNLEWATPSENNIHAIKHNLRKPVAGEDVHFAKYTNEQIELACKELEKDELSLKDIEKLTGVKCKALSDIRRGNSWKSIASKYNFPKQVYVESRYFDHVTNRKIHELAIKGLHTDDIVKELCLENSSKVKHTIDDIRWNIDPENKKKSVQTYIRYRKRHNKPYCVRMSSETIEKASKDATE